MAATLAVSIVLISLQADEGRGKTWRRGCLDKGGIGCFPQIAAAICCELAILEELRRRVSQVGRHGCGVAALLAAVRHVGAIFVFTALDGRQDEGGHSGRRRFS